MRPFTPTLVFTFFLLVSCNTLFARDRTPLDSTKLIRPRYAGFWLNTGNTFQAWPLFYHDDIRPDTLGPQLINAWNGSYVGGGVLITQPFSPKWDAELGIGLRAQSEKLEWATVTGLDSDQQIRGYTRETQTIRVSAFLINARVSCELFRGEKTALYAGAGGWAIFKRNGMLASFCGADAGLDFYYNVSPKWALRLRVAAGHDYYRGAGRQYPHGFCFSTGIAFCHQGSHDLRRHSGPYYIRTYED